jgi:hypothetical protein
MPSSTSFTLAVFQVNSANWPAAFIVIVLIRGPLSAVARQKERHCICRAPLCVGRNGTWFESDRPCRVALDERADNTAHLPIAPDAIANEGNRSSHRFGSKDCGTMSRPSKSPPWIVRVTPRQPP